MTEWVLTFYLSGSLCGIDIAIAKEINKNVDYTPVPNALDYVVGLLNLRGQIVTLVDLARLLHFKETSEQRKSHCIILKKNAIHSDPVGFFIDKMGDVIDVTSDMYQTAPANIGDIEDGFISKVIKLKHEVVLMLNFEKILKMD